MDSKAVSKEIRGRVWPLLKEHGFSRFTTRTAWRYCASTIDILNFQSFNAYNASVMRVTPFSFAVNLGCYLTYVPASPPKFNDGLLTPSEFECQLRGRLTPAITQAREAPHDVWSVDQQGCNLLWCVQDVVEQLPYAMGWFAHLADEREVLRILIEDDEDMTKLWGFGRNPSPIRSYLTGYVALKLDNHDLARKKLAEAVDSNCFTEQFGNLEDAISRVV